MRRRGFLHCAAALGALATLPLAARAAMRGSKTGPAFVLARSASGARGEAFDPLAVSCAGACTAAMLRVRIDGLHRAAGTPVLHELALSAMFDHGGVQPAPFLAWQFVHGAPSRVSQSIVFSAPRDGMRGFELEYRLAGDAQCRDEACALTRFGAPLLSPGHYVLLGPRRDGTRVDAAGLRHSGDALAPLGEAARDFDYLALRIEAIA